MTAEPDAAGSGLPDLTTDDHEWIAEEAARLFRENERRRGGVRPATITPQDFLDYWVAVATWSRARAAALARVEALDAESARLRGLIDACGPWLKDGETPAKRIEREFQDCQAVGMLLAKRTADRDALAARLAAVREAVERWRANAQFMQTMNLGAEGKASWSGSEVALKTVLALLDAPRHAHRRDGVTRACCNCEYHGDKGCHFPEPQWGGAPPFMVSAAMPDQRAGGAGCVQFRARRLTARDDPRRP